MAKKTIIGVTGGLATGKSTVTGMFVAKGAVRVDADAISHEILKNDAGIKKEVIATFGVGTEAGGGIARRELAAKVFFNADSLAKLVRIMHPAIIQRIKEEADKVKEGVVVVDAPLLIEAGMADFVDVVVVVTASHDTQLKRAIERGISKEEAEAIIRSQMPLFEKKRAADYIIDSDSDMETTKKGVESIWKRT